MGFHSESLDVFPSPTLLPPPGYSTRVQYCPQSSEDFVQDFNAMEMLSPSRRNEIWDPYASSYPTFCSALRHEI